MSAQQNIGLFQIGTCVMGPRKAPVPAPRIARDVLLPGPAIWGGPHSFPVNEKVIEPHINQRPSRPKDCQSYWKNAPKIEGPNALVRWGASAGGSPAST